MVSKTYNWLLVTDHCVYSIRIWHSWSSSKTGCNLMAAHMACDKTAMQGVNCRTRICCIEDSPGFLSHRLSVPAVTVISLRRQRDSDERLDGVSSTRYPLQRVSSAFIMRDLAGVKWLDGCPVPAAANAWTRLGVVSTDSSSTSTWLHTHTHTRRLWVPANNRYKRHSAASRRPVSAV